GGRRAGESTPPARRAARRRTASAPAGETGVSGRPRSSAAPTPRPPSTWGSTRRVRGRVLVGVVGSSFKQLLRERAVSGRASACGVVFDHGLAVTGGFADANVARDQRLQHVVGVRAANSREH